MQSNLLSDVVGKRPHLRKYVPPPLPREVLCIQRSMLNESNDHDNDNLEDWILAQIFISYIDPQILERQLLLRFSNGEEVNIIDGVVLRCISEIYSSFVQVRYIPLNEKNSN